MSFASVNLEVYSDEQGGWRSGAGLYDCKGETATIMWEVRTNAITSTTLPAVPPLFCYAKDGVVKHPLYPPSHSMDEVCPASHRVQIRLAPSRMPNALNTKARR